MLFEDTLVVIPARGGSKGLPGKNIKAMCGKPLIHYTIETARHLVSDEAICVSTDDSEIKTVAELTGLAVPFLRPAELATDSAGTYPVLLHAIEEHKRLGREYQFLLLLQPTSPFRKTGDMVKMMELILQDSNTEMIVSVGLSHHNPYFSLFEETPEGYLRKSKESNYVRRQDCPAAYYYNGSAYLIRTDILTTTELGKLSRVKKYVMEEKYCVDIDTEFDWMVCESLLQKGIYNNANN